MPVSKNHNFSQLTVLIVLLVITVITLTVTAWQIHINTNAQNDLNKKIANILANDITNRMHLNYKEFYKGQNSLYINSNVNQKTLINQHVDLHCYNNLTGCSTLTLAANDLIYWQQTIKDNLPNGVGKILWSESNKTIVININWDSFNKKKQASLVMNILMPDKSPHATPNDQYL